MIPMFPKFEAVSLAHKKEIITFTKKYLPYSDFNFTSLYSWNTDQATLISTLNDNLVIQMKDYSKNSRIISFLGTGQTHKTIGLLLSYAKKVKTDKLKLIPEINLSDISELSENFQIVEDRDQFDYVYDIHRLTSMEGSVHKKKRNLIKRFETEFGKKSLVKNINLKSERTRNQIQVLLENWQKNKKKLDKKIEQNELSALQKALDLSSLHDLLGIGIFLNDVLIGFTIGEILHKNYGMIHFEKTDHRYTGVSEYFMNRMMRIYKEKNAVWLNYQQDLGVDGLKKSKSYWKPSHFLKKYIISFKHR